jgi:chromosomal replication initiation ATPase DnaA
MPRPVQLPLDLAGPPALGEADFLRAPCNALAHDWVRRWPDWPGPVLVLTGPIGCGKTHLASIWARRAAARWLDGARLVAGIDPIETLQGARSCVVEDIEDLAWEPALLHLHNVLVERGGHLLLTTALPLGRLALADLRSRLRAASIVRVDPPSEELLAALLVKQLADRQLHVAPGVVTYLTVHMERSFAAARHIVARLDAASLSRQRPVTMVMAREVIREFGPPDAGEIAQGRDTQG